MVSWRRMLLKVPLALATGSKKTMAESWPKPERMEKSKPPRRDQRMYPTDRKVVSAQLTLKAAASSGQHILPLQAKFQVEPMVTPRDHRKSYPTAIEEAQSLVQLCAEPRPAGDQVKGAIFRASSRLGLSVSRTRDIWYGQARRIEAEEMDRLRRGAEDAELACALAGIEVLRNGMLATRSPAFHDLVAGLTVALRALGRDQQNTPADERQPSPSVPTQNEPANEPANELE